MPEFHPNESLLWKTRDFHSAATTIKTVVFLKEHGDGSADVRFGLDQFHRVPLIELEREQVNGIRPEFKPVQFPPPPPARVPIETRRETLRQCHANAALTAEAVTKATELVQRGIRELAACEVELRRIERVEENQVQAVTKALRVGAALPIGDHDFAAKQRIATRIAQAEVALATFKQELATAETAHRTAKNAVAIAASNLVGSIIECQADELRDLESTTAKLRSTLRSALEFWATGTAPVNVNTAIAAFLVQEPQHVVDPVGLESRQAAVEHRQSAYRQFYEQLLDNADAEWN